MSLTLREWRRVKEITQEAMAQQLNIHVNTYQKWEKEPGKICFEKAVQISKILNVPLDDIAFESSKAAV